MQTNNVKKIHDLEQSIWLDFIDRKIIHSGQLQKLIDEDGIRGVTSNPAIFEKAISSGTDYDEDIKKFAEAGESNEDIFFKLAGADIQYAADLFKPLYLEGDVKGADGYVSLEVSPRLARDTEGTIQQARELWKAVGRENVMIKIPGTVEGLPAVRKCISEAIHINVTLLFGLEQYRAVTDAYISGLEDRLNANLPVNDIASVASFFLSRIDVLIDPMLDEKGLGQLKGKTAIACAKAAYAIYKEVFSSERFKKLQEKGAKPQRLLWASTGSKNPAFKDTMYVEELIGPRTVNTIPMETLDAFRDHGDAKARLEENMEQANNILLQVKAAGINLDAIAQKLEVEGIEKFNQPYNKLMEAIEKQRQAMQV
jgi:transaldolase/transaldolase/glucose-6-phosphate isomerase